MNRRALVKRFSLISATLSVLLVILLLTVLPWAARIRHKLVKIFQTSVEYLAICQGTNPALVTLHGSVFIHRPLRMPLSGIEVEVIDSTSGWASITDSNGNLTLPDVKWYPGADYELIITANKYQVKRFPLRSANFSAYTIIEVGELDFELGNSVDVSELVGRTSYTQLNVDDINKSYYKDLFAQITRDQIGDENKITAINRYVAGRLSKNSTLKHSSARETLEQGSAHCGELATAMAMLVSAGDYSVRVIDLIDIANKQAAHMVVEVFYQNRWHLFDPIAGKAYRNRFNRIVSYTELHGDTQLISDGSMPEHLPILNNNGQPVLADLYSSGFHHYYLINW